jgi:hypothetical protein
MRVGNKSPKENCEKIYMRMYIQYILLLFCFIITYLYTHKLKYSRILSTHKLVVAAEYIEHYEIHGCDPFYYKLLYVCYVLPDSGYVMPKHAAVK